MKVIRDLFCLTIVLTMVAMSATAQELKPVPEAPTPDNHPGKSVYWTASGPVYIDQQLDALSRLIFPSNEQKRFQWLSDRILDQLDRQQGSYYSGRFR